MCRVFGCDEYGFVFCIVGFLGEVFNNYEESVVVGVKSEDIGVDVCGLEDGVYSGYFILVQDK